jgi:uncharacterized protein involved in type VI secretion and phage assembly
MDQTAVAEPVAARLARALVDRERTRRLTTTGTSNSPGLRAGPRIRVMQGGFGGGGHVVTTVQHAAWVEGGCFAYGNALSAVPDTVTFRPALRTPAPRVTGVLAALVSSVNDPEHLGRVKVKFPTPGAGVESDWVRTLVPLGPPDASPFLPDPCAVDLEVLV